MSEENISHALAKEEYTNLRKEISETVGETRALERYAVLSSAAIWTWLLENPDKASKLSVTVFVPFALCLFAGVRSAALYRDIIQHAKYILEVEKKWGEAKVISWEHYLLSEKKYLGLTAITIWVVLTFGNFALGVYMRGK